MSQEKSVNLFLTEGGSDKVYNVQLEPTAGGWWVKAQNGGRGKALRMQDKGIHADYAEALAIYERLVASKVKKGYTEDESGAAFTSAQLAGQDTGIRPQLLNEISLEEAKQLGSEWLVQQKHDGERRPMVADGKGRRFANRKGLEVGVQKVVSDAFEQLHLAVGHDLRLDAEDMGDHVVIFDLFNDDLFADRAAALAHLEDIIAKNDLSKVLRVDVPVPAPEFFEARLSELQLNLAEGFVLRRADSRYEAGRPNSGGSALKVKFWNDISCIVAPGRAGKRSVGLTLLDDNGQAIEVGNVTVPSSADIPTPGEVIDVKYLYAYEGGSLFQPVFRGLRTDVGKDECLMSRLTYKAKREADAEPAPAFEL